MRRASLILAVCFVALCAACGNPDVIAPAQGAQEEKAVPYALATDPASQYVVGIPNPVDGWKTVKIIVSDHKLLYSGELQTWAKADETGSTDRILLLQSRGLGELLSEKDLKGAPGHIASALGSKLTDLLAQRAQRNGGKVMLAFQRELPPIEIAGEESPTRLVVSNDREGDGKLSFAITCFVIVKRSQVLSVTYISPAKTGEEFDEFLKGIEHELLVQDWADQVSEYYTKLFSEERKEASLFIDGLRIWRESPK